MAIMLGNLDYDQMQQRAGVVFPDELYELMKDTNQSQATDVKPGKWHCFDMPFTLVCGDFGFAQKIYELLRPLSSDFTNKLQIAINQ